MKGTELTEVGDVPARSKTTDKTRMTLLLFRLCIYVSRNGENEMLNLHIVYLVGTFTNCLILA